jgi:aryl-alcohol dehydrogenase-like predicted oxidoreductase
MQTRKLGKPGLAVPPLAFGCNVFGWTVKEAGAFQLLDRLLATGLNFWDTADVYARWAPGNQGGESETLVGHWVKQRGGRDRVLIATRSICIWVDGSVPRPTGRGTASTRKPVHATAIRSKPVRPCLLPDRVGGLYVAQCGCLTEPVPRQGRCKPVALATDANFRNQQ